MKILNLTSVNRANRASRRLLIAVKIKYHGIYIWTFSRLVEHKEVDHLRFSSKTGKAIWKICPMRILFGNWLTRKTSNSLILIASVDNRRYSGPIIPAAVLKGSPRRRFRTDCVLSLVNHFTVKNTKSLRLSLTWPDRRGDEPGIYLVFIYFISQAAP